MASEISEAPPYVPFGERPGFEDVIPIVQDDGPYPPPVNIAYPPAFVDAMNYFRAMCAADERSERALLVTTSVIVRAIPSPGKLPDEVF